MKKIYVSICIIASLIIFQSHEYLLMSESYFLQQGDPLYIHLFVAQGMNVQLERPLQKHETKAFTLYTKNDSKNLLEGRIENDLPVYESPVDFVGQALFHMQRGYANITLPALEFAAYLKEDHLENIQFDPSKSTGGQREKYTRYLKCLVVSGNDTSGNLFNKELHDPLEIILTKSPFTITPSYDGQYTNELYALIQFKGNPLANKVVTIRNRNGDEDTYSDTQRTNSDGIVEFKIVREGDWVIHLTHMIPAENKSEADWESFWASYSFGIAK